MPHELGHEQEDERGFFGDVWQGVKQGVWNQAGPLQNFIPPQLQPDQNQWPLPSRPPLGLQADQFQQQHSTAVAQYMNKILANNLAQVNAGTAGINRTGGLQNQLSRDVASDVAFAGANVAGQGSMDIMRQLLNAQLMREGMDEQRLFNQAQINMGGQQANQQGMSDLLQLLILAG